MIDTHDRVPADQRLRDRLREMLLGYQVSQCLHVAAKLKIADLLEDGPKSVSELATATRTKPLALGRFLRALACHGVFAIDADGRFCLTPVATLLRSTAPHSMRAAAIYWGTRWMWEPWGNLLYSLQTGAPAFDHVHGAGFFEFLSQTPEAAQVFDQFISQGLHTRPEIVVSVYDFSASKVIADIGGGQGALLATILNANPTARGILFDRPHVLEGARGRLKDAGVIGRCAILAGDFFDSVPGGADTYLLSQIIHDWNDEQAIAVLRNCRSAMDTTAKLLLVEPVLEDFQPEPVTTLLDLTMLTIVGGKERMVIEYASLCAAAGFKLLQVMPTASQFSIIECAPA